MPDHNPPRPALDTKITPEMVAQLERIALANAASVEEMVAAAVADYIDDDRFRADQDAEDAATERGIQDVRGGRWVDHSEVVRQVEGWVATLPQ